MTAGWVSARAARGEAADPPSTWKAFDGHSGKEFPTSELPLRVATAPVIFLGEQHDDPQTHLAEAWLLEAVHQRVGDKLALAMEMFERDQQEALNQYLAGKLDAEKLKKAIKVWNNYETDYRPMVDYAKAKGIPVVASNAPLRIVRTVSGNGLPALKNLPATDKPLFAEYVTAPEGDAYFTRFAEVMGQGGHGDRKMDGAMIRRFYEAQCLRDDTMAESIVRTLNEKPTVLHVNGTFHSDAGLGTAARVLWRKPLTVRMATVKIIPFKGESNPAPYQGEGDYLLFVPDQRPARPAPSENTAK